MKSLIIILYKMGDVFCSSTKIIDIINLEEEIKQLLTDDNIFDYELQAETIEEEKLKRKYISPIGVADVTVINFLDYEEIFNTEIFIAQE